MLCLTRRTGEEIRIGPAIRVKIMDVRGGKVELGIDAPPGLRILRSELVPSFADLEAIDGDTA